MDKVKIKSIASVLSGNSAPQDKSLFTDGTYPFIRTGDVGKVHRSVNLKNPEDYLNAEGIKGLRLFPKGAILIPKSGASTLLNHRAILGEDSYVASHLAVIIPNNNKVSSKYLYYVLTSIDVGNLVANKAYPSLKTSVIGNVGIPLPHLNEQERIVAELDLLTDIIDKQKTQLKELDTLASSIFYDMFGNPVQNEKGWEVKKLGSVLKTTSGGTPSKKHPEYYEGGTIPWINSGDLHQMYIESVPKHITQSGIENSSAKLFPKDSVLVAMYGATVGEASILKIESSTNQAVCCIFPSKDYKPTFLYSVLKHSQDFFISMAAGGAQPNISQSIIKDFMLISPPLSLQQSFAEKIEAIERQKTNINASIAETQKLFDYTMDKYFG